MSVYEYPHSGESTWQGGAALAWNRSGLFLVVQEPPSTDGLIASKDAIRAVGLELGETLDDRIRNHAKAHGGEGEEFIHRMNQLVASQLIAVLEQAHMRVRALHQLGLVEEIPVVCVAKVIELSKEIHLRQRLFFAQNGGGQLLVQQNNRITQVHTPGVHCLDLRQGDRFVLLDRMTQGHVYDRIASTLQSNEDDSIARAVIRWELQKDRRSFADRPVHVLVHTV